MRCCIRINSINTVQEIIRTFCTPPKNLLIICDPWPHITGMTYVHYLSPAPVEAKLQLEMSWKLVVYFYVQAQPVVFVLWQPVVLYFLGAYPASCNSTMTSLPVQLFSQFLLRLLVSFCCKLQKEKQKIHFNILEKAYFRSQILERRCIGEHWCSVILPGYWKIPGYFDEKIPRYFFSTPVLWCHIIGVLTNTRVFDSLSNTRVNDS